MRLNQYEINSIKNCCKTVFGESDIYLFGSRTDDNKKGGDIDIYIIPQKKYPSLQLLEKKMDFLARLKLMIGDQKIDVIFAKDDRRLIEKEALLNGIKL